MSFLDNPIIQVALGLVLLYFGLALACLGICETISRKLSLRAQCLWRTVGGLVGNEELAGAIYKHHLIAALTEVPEDLNSKPSYIPGTLFASAVIEELGLTGEAGHSLDDLKTLLEAKKVPDQLQKAILALARESAGSQDMFRQKVSKWFEAATDRASGWYKRQMKGWSFYIACLIVLALNADTVNVGSTLWKQPTLRQQLASQAIETGRSKDMPKPGNETLQSAAMQSVLGWHGPISVDNAAYNADDPLRIPYGFGEWLLKAVGLGITIGMVSLGAPFWFDILNRAGGISSAGKKPTLSAETSSATVTTTSASGPSSPAPPPTAKPTEAVHASGTEDAVQSETITEAQSHETKH